MMRIGPEPVWMIAIAGVVAFVLAALRPSWRLWLGGYLLMLVALTVAYLARAGG